MRPVPASMARPGGRPSALNVREFASGSDAPIATSTAAPTVDDWLPGFERLGGLFTNVLVAWRHWMPKLSIQLPARPLSANAGLFVSQRRGPPAVPVSGPTAPRNVPAPASLPFAVSARHSKSSWLTYWLNFPRKPLIALFAGHI